MDDAGSLCLGERSLVFGVALVPPDVLVSEKATTSAASPEDYAHACVRLDAAFAFVPLGVEQSSYLSALRAHGIAPFCMLNGPLWPLIETEGVLEGLRRTLTDPDGFGKELDEGVRELTGRLIEAADLGAHALVLAEDLAGSEGPLVAPDFVITELMPRYASLVHDAKERGLPCVFHSDGDIRPLLPAIARAGFVGVHAGGGLDAQSFTRLLSAARAEGLTVIGGLLTQELVSIARAEALGGMLGRLVRAGGLFLADDGGITTSYQFERLKIALDVVRSL